MFLNEGMEDYIEKIDQFHHLINKIPNGYLDNIPGKSQCPIADGKLFLARAMGPLARLAVGGRQSAK